MTTDELSGGSEVQSNWFKFLSPGDGIKGTLVGRRDQPSNNPMFPDQLVCELKKADGTVWNVGVSTKKEGTVQRLKNVKIGEIIAVIFEKEGEVSKKGFAPAKYLQVKTWGMDPNFNELDGGEEAVPQM